ATQSAPSSVDGRIIHARTLAHSSKLFRLVNGCGPKRTLLTCHMAAYATLTVGSPFISQGLHFAKIRMN
ncbi:MAG: hypothetical protein ACXWJZ_16905, partial [Burkholderiaceae bacterium]